MTGRTEGLYVGESTDASHERDGSSVGIDPAELTTHGVIVGMTGSGKTGLGMVLLEEALTAGVPVLVLDPKGDMGNLLLTFPSLAPADFAPWVPSGTDPATVATQWSEGLAGWGLGGGDIGTLRTGHPMTVFTPGSTAGVPLDIIGSLAPPTGADPEAVHDEAAAITQGLLGLVGVESDPMAGREHVLIANLIETAWAADETLDLPTLLVRIQDPPMRKLGVIDVETFFPKADRTALMLRLNGLLASPSFAAWGAGEPLDIPSLLWAPDGSARASVIYLAHLSDEERQLVVTRVLSKLITWMRAQPGSPALRALVYMDEVYGFVPPTAAPPSKQPILTLYKQARAFGVGVVLATQNPVDLDYKAISNAGTWMIGRLQTERDKARLMEGLAAADGSVDTSTLDSTISSLAKREFLLHRVGKGAPQTFGVRWAMSYLAGPLSKDQLAALPGMPAEAGSAVPVASGIDESGSAAAAPPSADASPVAPAVADGIDVRYLDPAAPWAASVGVTPGGTRLDAAVALRCSLRYDDATADLDVTEEWEAILHPLDDGLSPDAAVQVDFDDRDFLDVAPAGVDYVLPPARIDTKASFTKLQTALKDWLVSNRATAVPANRALKLYGRPGETEADFAARCRAAADAGADAEADKIRAKLEARADRLRDLVADAQLKADQLRDQASTSKQSEFISGAGSLLGNLLGGRKSARSISGALNKAATGRARTQRTEDRMEQALARVDAKQADLAELEADLADELADIATRWDDAAAAIETLDVPLEKSDIAVTRLTLLWLPTAP